MSQLGGVSVFAPVAEAAAAAKAEKSDVRMDPSTLLIDVPPLLNERICVVLDTGDDRLGWRGLAVRIAPRLLDIRILERQEAAGRSPTRELLWSWAQQNAQVQDLIQMLQDMGNWRALQIIQGTSQTLKDVSPASVQPAELVATMKESGQSEQRQSSQTLSPMSTPAGEKSPHITFHDIIQGTKDFQHEVRLSEGRFSDLYRAQIHNRVFAVKLFKQINAESWKKTWDNFRKEIHHLQKHPNILDTLGCFSDDSRYCLLYPFLPNGSLYFRLHQKNDGPPLSWEQRVTIIKGTARALHHLHTSPPCAIICGNISSANILLDESFQPKLTDFGLACLRPHLVSQGYTTTMDTRRHSNLGYLPEDYIRDGKLSLSLDVYSFGMVLMETVTGRKVIEEKPKKTLLREVLVTEVENSGGVDSCLQFLDGTAGEWVTAVAIRLLGLALDCTSSRRCSRPNMENVIQKLSQVPSGQVPLSSTYLDPPHSLDDRAPLKVKQNPVEHDEHQDPLGTPGQSQLCECSQSKVAASQSCGDEAGLYRSWPVQCSCPAEMGGRTCEDCRANGFTSSSTLGKSSVFTAAVGLH